MMIDEKTIWTVLRRALYSTSRNTDTGTVRGVTGNGNLSVGNHTYKFQYYFIDYNKTLLQRPQKINAQGCLPLKQRGFIKSTPLERQAAPSLWWWCLLSVCVVVN
jgi:hypothetical protein